MNQPFLRAGAAFALAFLAADAGAQTGTAPAVSGTAAPAASPSPADVSASQPVAAARTGAAPGPQQLSTVEVRGQRARLDAARSSLSPDTGSTIYRFDANDIAALPLGDATPLNQVVLRAPGVVGDSFGQVHVRGDHANLQYRINGVVIPEAISGFGQVLDTRFADSIEVLTGALPAQYGYRTAGVVDIRTKGSELSNSGSLDVVFGSRGHRELSAEVGGTQGRLSWFVTGSGLSNDIGIENPTAARDALHDQTRQGKGFAYLSYLLGAESRVSLMLGSSNSRFQIPNVPGQTPDFSLAGTTVPPSENLDANQHERNNFQALSLQSTFGAGVDYQVTLLHRYSDVHYEPDPAGDLAYFGVAANVLRRNETTGLQFDLSAALSAQHTLRAGVYLQRERAAVANASQVFPADDDGNQTSNTPVTITDDAKLAGHLYGVYVQDEWQPSKALTINYGLRYDQVSTVTDESQLSPRLGLVYQLGDNTRLHAGYARYFTPPPTEKIDTTSVQKFLGTTNALPSDANTAVCAERSDYFDLGVSHQLTPRLTLGADAYYRKVRHLQDEGQFGNALIYSAFNYERGRVYGLELSASYKDERLSGYANVSLSRALGKGIETGQFNFDADELAYISQNWVHLDHDQTLAASTGLSWKIDDATTIGADVLYGSGLRRGFANSEHLPAYTQVNASATRSFVLGGFGKFDTRVSVTNLFDRSYELRDGSGIGVGAPQFAPRRTFYVAFSKPFSF